MTSLREKAAELALTIHVMDVMPEDAYLYREPDPRWNGAEIAVWLQGETPPVLREACAHLRSRLIPPWSGRDFAATVGASQRPPCGIRTTRGRRCTGPTSLGFTPT